MADADLFMECEEEELEPWQKMNDDVEDEELPRPGCSLSSVLPPAVGQPTVPSLVTQGLPKPAPGQQLILTQSPGGLGAVAMSHVLQPMQVMQGPAPGTSAATNQPIYFTTQGFPVQNVRPVQNPVNPLGIVLNVQPGQTVRPITLVSGTQFFKPAVGVPQVVSQPGPIRPGAPIAGRPASTTYTTVQIPATLTIRSNTPLSHPGAMGLATVVTSAATQPVHSSALPQNSQSKTGKSVLSVSQSASPPLFSAVFSERLCPYLLSGGSILIPCMCPCSAVPPPASVPGSRLCPRCGAHFRMVEALRGHMCFCCPELTQNLSSTESPMSSGVGALGEGSPAGDTDPQGRLIMLVDEFYYGSYEGKRGHAPQDVTRESVQFKCLSCSKKLKNNIRLMNHMKHHMELEQQNGEVDTHTYCQHCYRQFPTPFQLQCHLESVHSNYESSTTCKICEWAFESEPAFLQHMKNTHKPGEMPYICQVCEYRSSYYSDVYNHFRTCHEDTKNLLCLYCLKVFKNSNSYQQHYIRHQKKTVCYCNKCRLQFLFTKDKMDHKVNHHKTFRKPKQLEGLLPGTKVTIRAYAAQNKPTPGLPPAPLPAPPVRDAPSPVHSEGHQKQPLPQPPIKRKSVSKMLELLTKFQEQREVLGPQTCLECNYDVPDFANHFPTYVHCSICRYSTCCSRAYANHMINNHVPRKSTKYLALYRKPVPSWAKLTCSSCSYSTLLGDLMAKHLVQFPSHSYSLCSLKGSPKLGYVMERQSQPSVRPTLHTIPPASPSLHPPTNVGKDLDQETTPGKHLDVTSSKNATDASHGKELKPVSSASTVAPVKPAVDVAGRKEREENLSVRQLRIVLFALCCGIPQAAEHFSTQPQLIETWLLEKERQLRREGRPSSGGGGEAVDRLVEWVLAQREQQLPVTEKSLFQKASEIHRHANPSSSFRISYEWAVGFMLQNDLGLRPTDMVGRRLPWSMEDNAQGFTKFVHKQIQVQNFSPSVICAMDELSVFVDLDLLGNPVTVGKEAAFQLVGTGESLCDIFLAMLADGRLLPTMVFFKGQLPGRLRTNLPESILFEAKAEGFTEDEELELWISRVWQKYMNSQGESKAMLIMDPFRSHLSDVPLASFSAANTLPTVIPEGCTCRLQPLEMCVWPVLQAFLQARWTRLVAQGGAAGASDKDLVQLLMAWLVEALTCLKSLPDLLRRSFHVARVLPGMTGDAAPVEEQREMVCKLTEALLGPEALRTTSAAPRESETNSGPENESKLHGEDEEDGREVDKKQEAAGEVGMEVTEVQMNEEHLKKYEEFGAVLPPGSLVPYDAGF
uniref:Pogo transposable element derived with ZNF domain b n=1 Tax=Paramormyrops kingsleyae TaxID=1676925 RepID=A0A3B3SKF9_9TELE